MQNVAEFVGAMQRRFDPDIADEAEALYWAMTVVEEIRHGSETFYFGEIGRGTFFSNGNFDDCRWYPETSRVEAIRLLRRVVGEDAANTLEVTCLS